MQMIREDNTTIYFVIAVIFHSLFIVSINPFSVIKDVAVIGESGMNVQMILIQKGDENFDKAIMSENKRNELDDEVKKMINHDGPYLLEVMIEKEENVFPMIPSGSSVSDIRLE